MGVDGCGQAIAVCAVWHQTNSTRDGVKCPSGAPGSRDWGVKVEVCTVDENPITCSAS